MAKAYLGLGSNVGDRAGHLTAARSALEALPRTKLLAFSPVYETAAVGPVTQGAFLNAAAILATELSPGELQAELQRIEMRAGREAMAQRVRWGPRTLDLDILLYDDLVLFTPALVIPHPLLTERWFVLKPLADIAPEVKHPVRGVTVKQLLEELEENAGHD